jgi:hypothetical protein
VFDITCLCFCVARASKRSFFANLALAATLGSTASTFTDTPSQATIVQSPEQPSFIRNDSYNDDTLAIESPPRRIPTTPTESFEHYHNNNNNNNEENIATLVIGTPTPPSPTSLPSTNVPNRRRTSSGVSSGGSTGSVGVIMSDSSPRQYQHHTSLTPLSPIYTPLDHLQLSSSISTPAAAIATSIIVPTTPGLAPLSCAPAVNSMHDTDSRNNMGQSNNGMISSVSTLILPPSVLDMTAMTTSITPLLVNPTTTNISTITSSPSSITSLGSVGRLIDNDITTSSTTGQGIHQNNSDYLRDNPRKRQRHSQEEKLPHHDDGVVIATPPASAAATQLSAALPPSTMNSQVSILELESIFPVGRSNGANGKSSNHHNTSIVTNAMIRSNHNNNHININDTTDLFGTPAFPVSPSIAIAPPSAPTTRTPLPSKLTMINTNGNGVGDDDDAIDGNGSHVFDALFGSLPSVTKWKGKGHNNNTSDTLSTSANHQHDALTTPIKRDHDSDDSDNDSKVIKKEEENDDDNDNDDNDKSDDEPISPRRQPLSPISSSDDDNDDGNDAVDHKTKVAATSTMDAAPRNVASTNTNNDDISSRCDIQMYRRRVERVIEALRRSSRESYRLLLVLNIS